MTNNLTFEKVFLPCDKTKIYVSEGGYIIIEQDDAHGQMGNQVVALLPGDIPAFVDALQKATEVALKI